MPFLQRIARQKTAHEARQALRPAFQKNMGMVIRQGKRVHTGTRMLCQNTQALEKLASVWIVIDNTSSLDPTDHYMMQRTRCIQSQSRGIEKECACVYPLFLSDSGASGFYSTL